MNNIIAPSEERGFKGIWIPAEIWLNTEISHIEKILWAEINSLDKGNGCHASNEYLANFLGVKEHTITIMVSHLKKVGLIKQIAFDGRKRILSAITSSPLSQQQADCHENDRQTVAKITPYNKVYNKDDNSLIDNDNGNIDTPKNDSFALVSDFYPKDEQSIPPDNKKPSKRKIPTKQQVLAIYDAYPRKDAKQMGLRAIEKAIKKGHSPEMLLQKTKLYAQKMSWQDKQFIPYPSTWFNREQFLDDPSAWDAPASNNNGRYSSQRRLSPDQIKPRTKREILMTEPWRANELKDIDDDDTPF